VLKLGLELMQMNRRGGLFGLWLYKSKELYGNDPSRVRDSFSEKLLVLKTIKLKNFAKNFRKIEVAEHNKTMYH